MSLKPSRIPVFKGRPLASALADVGFSLGAAAASGAKKSKPSNNAQPGAPASKKGARKTKAGLQIAGQVSTTPVSSVVSCGYMTNSVNAGHKHSPFLISGSCILGSIASNASNALILSNSGATATPTLKFTLDVVGASTSAANFGAFPLVIRNVAFSFVRYRIKKYNITYIPTCPTSTAGTYAVGVSPEVVATSDSTNFGTEIVSFSRNMTGPMWAGQTLYSTGDDGIDAKWYYVDPSATLDESNLRQEAPGSIFVGSLGTLPASTSFGYFRADYEIELLALQNAGIFNVSRGFENKVQSERAAIAQPLVVVPQTGQAAPPPTPEHTFVYVPGNQRYTPQL